ncbi:MAG: hypothetical protein ACK4ZJ_16505, partial [Allorhizobium sp.]
MTTAICSTACERLDSSLAAVLLVLRAPAATRSSESTSLGEATNTDCSEGSTAARHALLRLRARRALAHLQSPDAHAPSRVLLQRQRRACVQQV